MQYMFENKGKWFGESAKRFKEEEDLTNDEMLALDEDDDFSDLVADDELDLVDDEQPMNEVRYIDPKNLDRYEPDEIEEVTDAQGNKRYKRSGNTGAGRNAQGSYQKKTDAKQGFNQDLANNLLSYGQEDYDEFMNIANQMDPDEYPNDFRRAVAQNTNIPDKVAMDFIDAYDYNDMDKWKNAKAQEQPKQEPKPAEGNDLKSFADNYGNKEAKQINDLQDQIKVFVGKERRSRKPGLYSQDVKNLRNKQKELLKPLANQLTSASKEDAVKAVKDIMDKAGIPEKDKNNFGYMLAGVPIDDSGKTLADTYGMKAYEFGDLVGKYYK